jgi:hypothetical protein
MRRTLVLATATLLLVVAAACTPRDTTGYSCLNGRPVYVVPTPVSLHWPSGLLPLANGTTIDARGVTFDNSNVEADGYYLGIKIDDVAGSRDDLCVVGGSVLTSIDPENTPWATWHIVTGVTVMTANAQLVGTSMFDEGDGFSFGSTGTNWTITGANVSGGPDEPGAYIHDDCVEDDSMNAGLVTDSLFDGCSDFLSALYGGTGTPPDGSANTIEVSNTLVRLQPYQNSYNTAKYGFDQHGGFFKWASIPSTQGVPPQLYVHDSVFRADSPGKFSGNVNGFLGLPPGSRCDHVTLVNTDAWPAGDLASWTSQCTNITYATTADWDADVAAWHASHPSM